MFTRGGTPVAANRSDNSDHEFDLAHISRIANTRMMNLPTFFDVEAAAEAISGEAVRTPLINNSILDEQVNGRVFLKAECLQRTGSFKFRGAYNALSRLGKTARENGVVACSSGNHAQGVAEAARILGFSATIIMPEDAPQSKKQRTVRSGAQIIEYDRYKEDREEITQRFAEETGAMLIHPYETFHVIAGQGTAGLEACEDLNKMGLVPDHFLVCAGGGGLMAGILLAAKHHFPAVAIHPVEPQGYDDQTRSHLAGRRLAGNTMKPSICDAVLTPMPGEASFAICKGRLGKGLIVTDQEALDAVKFAFHELKLVVEPGGAVTLAALLTGKLDVTDKVVLATLSGGNVDAAVMGQALGL